MTPTQQRTTTAFRPGLRRRRALGALFGGLALGALLLGLLVLLVLITTTVLQSTRLVAMRATADAGLALSLRNLYVERGGQAQYRPYVSISRVLPGSPAEALGLRRGDALVRLGERPVETVGDAWAVVAEAPGRRAELALGWVPRRRDLLGSLQAVPVPDRPGEFRVTLVRVAPGSPAERAGLRPGDVLLEAGGLPITGTHQAWQAVVVAARTHEGNVPLTVEREGRRVTVVLPAERRGKLAFEKGLLRAYWAFLTSVNEPRYPEHAGLASAFLGSLYVILVTALVAFPLGIGAAVYLEEYARRGFLTEVLQILIANLAGVPSVIYGIIGLEILARSLNLGRSILAGGITLALLVLPIMIIAAREALRTVPPSIREAAYGVGATRWQVLRHHVLPYALPGIFTGMILALSRALGEAAPLLLLGAFLYVSYLPQSLWDSFTVIPLQIFDWATKPQEGFAEVAAAAIVVLLILLLLLNGTAIWLRNRYQKRWSG